MQPSNRVPTHPGEVLREEFLAPLGQTQVALAEHLGIPLQRVNEIVRGKRGVTPETAWVLAQPANGVRPLCSAPRSQSSTLAPGVMKLSA
jgi:addiction module HigA family antidote